MLFDKLIFYSRMPQKSSKIDIQVPLMFGVFIKNHRIIAYFILLLYKKHCGHENLWRLYGIIYIVSFWSGYA